MTNSKGHLEPSDNSGNTINLTLYKSQDVAVKNPLAIYIDRVVAKVRVYTSDGAMDNSTASIYSPKWILNVTNNGIILYRGGLRLGMKILPILRMLAVLVSLHSIGMRSVHTG